MDLQHLHHGMHYGHVFSNNDEERPMVCGLFTINGGEPVVGSYPASAFIIGLEGAYSVSHSDALD